MYLLHVLGPVLLHCRDALVPLPVKKTQALLLLLTGRHPMPRTELAALLWPGLDTAVARRNLRRELARLREAGADGLVRAEGDLLALAPGTEVDLHRFDAALAAGLPDAALALWRGPLAHGLALADAEPFDDWLAQARQRVGGQRLQALCALADTLEARQDHAGALQHVQQLLAEDPLQEQHHRSAMRLLGQLGRPAAALQQYDQCCRLLADELGLAPMDASRDLAAQLRNQATGGVAPPAAGGQDAGVAVAAPVHMLHDLPPDLPPDLPLDMPANEPPQTPLTQQTPPLHKLPRTLPFVGRQAEVQQLEAAWAVGGPLLLEGEAGLGKSRLAADFAAAHGPHALVRARPGDAELPYAVFARALRALAGGLSALADLPAGVVAELARLLPELGPPPPPMAGDADRARLAQACMQAWRALADDSFDAVLLDDWHHADAASQALLVQVVHSRAAQAWRGAREVLVFRPDLDSGARQQLQALVADTPACHLVLGPLPADAVFTLVQQLSGARAPLRFAERLRRAAGGNPFFIGELLRDGQDRGWLQAAADGSWRTPWDDATQDYRELPLPASVREVVLARMQRLPDTAQRLLEAAALAEEPFDAALLAPACAMSEVDAGLALEAALDVGLLRMHEPVGLGFMHDLVQQALEAALAPARRRLVHRRLALGAEAAGAAPAAIAHHHECAGDVRRAAAWRLAAGDAAERLNALDDAVLQWQRALDQQPVPDQQLQLHMRLARTRRRQGRLDLCGVHLQAIQALAPQAGPALWHDAVAEAACTLVTDRRPQQALDMLDVLPPAPDARRADWAALRRAQALAELGRLDEAMAVVAPLQASPALTDRARAELLDTLVMFAWQGRRLQDALALLAESSRLAQQLGDQIGLARIRYRRANLCLELGDLDGAEADLLAAVDASRGLGQSANLLALLQSLCEVYRQRADWPRVVATVQQARQPPHGPPQGLLRYAFGTALAQAWHALGDADAAWAEAEPALADLLALSPHMQVEAAGMLPLGPFVQRRDLAALQAITCAVQAARGDGDDADAAALLAALQAASHAVRQARADKV